MWNSLPLTLSSVSTFSFLLILFFHFLVRSPVFSPFLAPEFWSNPNTWPNGLIPGIGESTGANVTIPCGKFVILDVENVTLGLLRVQGLLKFLDDPNLPSIYVRANYILVEGQLFIGSSSQQYRQKAIIELTPHPTRSTLKYTFSPPAEPAYPRNFGHKAFVVVNFKKGNLFPMFSPNFSYYSKVGGQVRLHGLPGPSNMPVWVRLSKNAEDDDVRIQVDADVAGSWPIGGEIAVTSSDYSRFQAESFKIINGTVFFLSGDKVALIFLPLFSDKYRDR